MTKNYDDTASLDLERGSYLLTTDGNKQRKAHTGRLRFWSFLLPILLLLPAFAYTGIVPFGSTTTLSVDLQHQYVGFFEGMRHALESHDAFLYSMTKSMGGDMVGTFAYYLTSPLTLLLFLAPAEKLPVMVELVQLLKIGFAGFAFSCLLIRREGGRDFRVVIFSTLYALCAFIPANMLNQMWLDPIALFPLVILYLEKLLDGDNPLPYILLLALTIWTNFYIAYMGCIFLILFTLYYLIRRPQKTGRQQNPPAVRSFFKFVLASLIAAAITACLLIPTIYSLILSKGAYSLNLNDRWKFIYPPLDFFVKLIPGAFNFDQVPNGLPNVFTGTLCTLGLIFYLCNGKIAIREKIASFLILAILYFSMVVDAPNIIWHGMQHPVWYNYRFSWLFSFFIALLSFRSWIHMNHFSIPGAILSLLGAGALIYYTYLHRKDYDFLEIGNLIYFLAMVIVSLILLYLCMKPHSASRNQAFGILCLITFGEVAFSSAVSISSFSYEKLPDFQYYDRIMNEALSPLRPDPQAGKFWRIEKTFMHDNNDGMRFNYNGISHFNSALETRSVNFCSSLGFPTTRTSINGTNPTKFTDALFGIRYYLDSSNLPNLEGQYFQLRSKSMRPDFQDMKAGKSYDHIQVYENTESMPICLLAEEGLGQLKPGRMNPMDFQDDLANLLDGYHGEINYFRREPVDLEAVHGLRESMDSEGMTRYDRTGESDPLQDELNPEAELKQQESFLASDPFKTEVQPVTSSVQTGEKPYLDYSFQTQPGSSYYLSVSNTLNNKNSLLYFDQREIPNKRTGSHVSSQIYNVSAASSPEGKHQLQVKMMDDVNSFTINNISLFSLDERALQDAVSFQNTQGFKLSRMTNTHMEGQVTAKENTPWLLLTLPYDPGWSVSIDGQKAELVEVMDSLMAVRLSPGTHQVVWQYQPRGLKLACLISLAGLAGALALGIGHQVRKHKER